MVADAISAALTLLLLLLLPGSTIAGFRTPPSNKTPRATKAPTTANKTLVLTASENPKP
jgi:hypothetical protein